MWMCPAPSRRRGGPTDRRCPDELVEAAGARRTQLAVMYTKRAPVIDARVCRRAPPGPGAAAPNQLAPAGRAKQVNRGAGRQEARLLGQPWRGRELSWRAHQGTAYEKRKPRAVRPVHARPRGPGAAASNTPKSAARGGSAGPTGLGKTRLVTRPDQVHACPSGAL